MTIKIIEDSSTTSSVAVTRPLLLESAMSASKLVSLLKSQRISERERLNCLNAKMIEYLDKVKILEEMNMELSNAITEIKKKLQNNVEFTKGSNQAKLNEINSELGSQKIKAIEALVKSRSNIYYTQLLAEKANCLEKESLKDMEKIKILTCYNDTLRGDISNAQDQSNQCQNLLNESKITSECLTNKLRELNAELDKTRLEKFDFDLKLKFLSSEIQTNKAVHEQCKNEFTIKNAVENNEKIVQDMEFYKNELDLIKNNLRSDFQEKLKQERFETESFYINKINEYEKPILAKKLNEQVNMGGAKVKITQEVLNEMAMMNEKYLSYQESERMRSISLEKKFEELSAKLNNIRKDNMACVEEKDMIIDELKRYTNDQVNAYNVDMISLLSEINVYKRLLENGLNGKQKDGANLVPLVNTPYVTTCSPNNSLVLIETNVKQPDVQQSMGLQQQRASQHQEQLILQQMQKEQQELAILQQLEQQKLQQQQQELAILQQLEQQKLQQQQQELAILQQLEQQKLQQQQQQQQPQTQKQQEPFVQVIDTSSSSQSLSSPNITSSNSNNYQINNLSKVKGPIGIREVSLDSKCIVVENTSEVHDFDLSGWTIKRNINDLFTEIVYVLPQGVVLNKKSRINIWANGVSNVVENYSSDIVNRNVNDWGSGFKTLTKLYDSNLNLKAFLIQKSITK